MVSEKGYGKRTYIDDPEDGEAIYRVTNRGGKGVKTISISEKTGDLISILNVVDGNHLMIINKSGIAIRLKVDKLRVMGRATQGVTLIKLDKKDSIAAVAKVVVEDDEEDMDDDMLANDDSENVNSTDNNENIEKDDSEE